MVEKNVPITFYDFCTQQNKSNDKFKDMSWGEKQAAYVKHVKGLS